MGQKMVVLDMQTMNKGAALELFEIALKRVMDNIGDVNTAPDFTREIVLTFKFKPSKDRSALGTSVDMKTKLASIPASVGSGLLDHDGEGNVTAYTSMVKDAELPLESGQRQEAQQK